MRTTSSAEAGGERGCPLSAPPFQSREILSLPGRFQDLRRGGNERHWAEGAAAQWAAHGRQLSQQRGLCPYRPAVKAVLIYTPGTLLSMVQED